MKSTARLGQRCTNPMFQHFKHYFDDSIQNDVEWHGWEYKWKKMDRKVKIMERFVAVISQLYQEWSFWKQLRYQYRRGFTSCWKYYFILSISEAAIIIFYLGFSRWAKSSLPKSKWGRAKNIDVFGVELAKNAGTLPLNLSTLGPRAWIQFAWLPLACNPTNHVSSSLIFHHHMSKFNFKNFKIPIFKFNFQKIFKISIIKI